MAARTCPHCRTEISAAEVAAYSNGLACPKCKAGLEVASGPRTVSSICGLAAAGLAYYFSSGPSGDLASVLPLLYAFLSFGVVASAVLMLVANLRNAPLPPVAATVHEPPGRAASGHH